MKKLIMIFSILFRTSNNFSASALISEKCVPELNECIIKQIHEFSMHFTKTPNTKIHENQPIGIRYFREDRQMDRQG